MNCYSDGLSVFPVRLKAARVAAGLSVRKAAHKAGVSVSALSYAESASDPRIPGLEIVCKLCDTYKCSLDDLFSVQR